MQTENMDTKPLDRENKGCRCTMTKKANVELNIQDNKISSSCYVSNLRGWDAILGQPLLSTLNVIMDITNNMVSMQPTG